MKEPLHVLTRWGSHDVDLVLTRYVTFGNTCLRLDESGERFATLTVNFEQLPQDLAYIDTLNHTYAEDFIREYRLGAKIGKTKSDWGWDYPLYELALDRIRTIAWRIVE